MIYSLSLSLFFPISVLKYFIFYNFLLFSSLCFFKSDIEDPLRLPCNLRCIITRLLSVRQLRLSVKDQLDIAGGSSANALKQYLSLNNRAAAINFDDTSRSFEWLSKSLDEYDIDALLGNHTHLFMYMYKYG